MTRKTQFTILATFLFFWTALPCGTSSAAGLDAAGMSNRLLMNRRVLWLGDSISNDGKYVTFVQYYLDKKFADVDFDFVSIGLSSETVSGLSEKAHPFPRPCVFERLQRALDAVRPATVIACYGMNDGIYHPPSDDRMKAFEDGIARLIDESHKAEAQVILMTPPPFDPVPLKTTVPASAADFSFMHPFVNYDAVLGSFSRFEMGLPTAQARVVVDLHTALADYIADKRKQDPAFGFTHDGIHPGPAGHLLMARTILRSLGVEVGNGDLDAELNTIESDPLFDLVRQQREKRSTGWLSYVGYTRDKPVKTDSIDAVEAANAQLQIQIDGLRRSGK